MIVIPLNVVSTSIIKYTLGINKLSPTYFWQVVRNVEIFDELVLARRNGTEDDLIARAFLHRAQVPLVAVELFTVVLTLEEHLPA